MASTDGNTAIGDELPRRYWGALKTYHNYSSSVDGDNVVACLNGWWIKVLTAVGSDSHYTHDQGVASAEWVVNHNLAKLPAVTVTDSTGAEVMGAVTHVSANQAILTFSAPFSGRATFN